MKMIVPALILGLSLAHADQADDVAATLQADTMTLNGYFTNYGSDKFDWAYVTSDLQAVYKLDGLNADGSFDWLPISTPTTPRIDGIVVENGQIVFGEGSARKVDLGVRPAYLVANMDEGELKTELEACVDMPMTSSTFSIGHRGAALQFPEHTKESYMAGARMGAGIVECDVTFTKDKELVCRHSQCDLHTTTNILATDLASSCSVAPAFDEDGLLTNASEITCCTSDITLAEFKTLQGKMDAANKSATTIEDYMNATAAFRTDLYASTGTLMSHAESIALFQELGVKMTPELKTPSIDMPYEGMTQEDYAQKMIDEYKAADVDPSDVFAQSFKYSDIEYWVANEPEFGAQAVYLDGRYGELPEDIENYPDFDINDPSTWEPRSMAQIKADGVNFIAPPLWVLITLQDGAIVPSAYAEAAKEAGLEIITWTIERSGTLTDGGGWYYQSVTDAINNSGDMLTVIDVLSEEVGVVGIFSDWPATVTFYANCKGK